MDSIVAFWRANRFSTLLFALLLFLVAAPVYQILLSPFLASLVSFVIYTVVLIAAVLVTRPSGNLRIVLVALAMATAALLAAALLTESRGLSVVFYVFSFLFLGLVAVVTISRLLQSHSADYETIAASICGYIILVLFWANAYSLMDTTAVGSFSAAQTPANAGQLMHFALGDAMMSLYYSFVTMTTLGYGDVLPVTPMARVLAATQAFVGQVYIAVLVARLVGLEIAQRVSGR